MTGPSRLLPAGWQREVLRRLADLALALVLYRVYGYLRDAQGRSGVAPERAERHGRDVLAVERALHIDLEHAVQQAVLAAPHGLIQLLDDYYALVHLPMTAGVFAWLLVRRDGRAFAVWRNRLVAGTGVALAVFAALPTMPPRLLPPERGGLVDTVGTYGGLFGQRVPALEHLEHPFAALPSLHLIWALWAGTALHALARWAWLRRLGLVHVAATVLVVLATGNHWLLDVVAGAAVYALTCLLFRRPDEPGARAPALSDEQASLADAA